jgi:hypothetical protein
MLATVKASAVPAASGTVAEGRMVDDGKSSHAVNNMTAARTANTHMFRWRRRPFAAADLNSSLKAGNVTCPALLPGGASLTVQRSGCRTQSRAISGLAGG